MDVFIEVGGSLSKEKHQRRPDMAAVTGSSCRLCVGSSYAVGAMVA
jgi:hypothetical protein